MRGYVQYVRGEAFFIFVCLVGFPAFFFLAIGIFVHDNDRAISEFIIAMESFAVAIFLCLILRGIFKVHSRWRRLGVIAVVIFLVFHPAGFNPLLTLFQVVCSFLLFLGGRTLKRLRVLSLRDSVAPSAGSQITGVS